jgi:hypothetical protein
MQLLQETLQYLRESVKLRLVLVECHTVFYHPCEGPLLLRDSIIVRAVTDILGPCIPYAVSLAVEYGGLVLVRGRPVPKPGSTTQSIQSLEIYCVFT